MWNKRTGNLVSGHQRITIVDALEGTDDYDLDFSVVDLSEDDEKQANIAFNNESAMGQFDAESLSTMIASMTEGADASIDSILAGTGFDLTDLALLLPESFQLTEVPDVLGAVEEQAAKAKESNSPARRRRHEAPAFDKSAAVDTDTEFYAVLLFTSREKREDFMERVGCARDERYADGANVVSLLEG